VTIAPAISVAIATSTASQPLRLARVAPGLKRRSNCASGISATTSASTNPAITGTIATKNAGRWYQCAVPTSQGTDSAVTSSGNHHQRRPR